MTKSDIKVSCSFCGKSRSSVEKLIAGPNVYICNECIIISYDIVSDSIVPSEDISTSDILLTPEQIKAKLDDYIVGQTEVKELLSTCVYNHYKRLKLNAADSNITKSNILLMGSTGTGKTLFAKTLADIMDVPFAIADATTLTEAGYVGEDVESVLERLLSVADYDVEKAQQGIIYIDEIDKKSRNKESSTSSGKDVSGEGVQQALLRLIEGTTTKLRINNHKGYSTADEFIEFDTTNILFIVGGAFVGIEDTIEKRVQKSGGSIGFRTELVTSSLRTNLLSKVTPGDVILYGLIPELVGRLPLIGTLDELTIETYVHIMATVKNNIIEQTQELLKLDGIDIEFKEEFIEDAAKRAAETGLGARALRAILDHATLNIMFRAPSLHDSGVTKIIFNKYPIDVDSFPELVYDNKTCIDTQYKLFRG